MKKLVKEILQFRDERNWKQFHQPKNLAHDSGIDLDAVLTEKMKKNREKYPVEKSKGKSKKYTELE